MFVALLTFLFVTFVILRWRKALGKGVWTVFILLACATSFLFAYVSVASVWVPHPLSDYVFAQQNALGEYEGTFPSSKLSYPLNLRVYHTPFNSLIFEENDIAYGQVYFSVLLADAEVIGVDGDFSFFYGVYGPMPLQYKIDFFFSDSPEFFGFLVALHSFVNIVGALVGIISAKTLYHKVHVSR